MKYDEYLKHVDSLLKPECRTYKYLVPGLIAEIGEIFGHYAKYQRGDFDWDECNRRIRKELGDVWFFLAAFEVVYKVDILKDIGAVYTPLDLFDIYQQELRENNIEKLRDRRDRGQLQGDGDDR